MRYVSARFKAQQREEAYRIFLTETIRIIGNIKGTSYFEWAYPEHKEKRDNRTGEEIIFDLEKAIKGG